VKHSRQCAVLTQVAVYTVAQKLALIYFLQ